ncbi:MAG TPA: methylated-DNA--[protein]-cysteine S-methyltransferase [Candidatus Polarisedimenticolia bacterium]|nr:methylated-DNA--[protein]-cysteine S-methyltransferase [Candidatus Polarisedimenticolia bacterium]
MHLETIESPLGSLLAVADQDALRALEFVKADPVRQLEAMQAALGATFQRGSHPHPLLERLRSQLAGYFDGSRRRFDLPLRFAGTPFQERVWNRLLEIPYGEVRSYLDLARDLGDPKAVRAVGGANGSNPISILVPCHRVIGADGSIVGYGGGLERKEWLLAHERGERRLF